MILTRMLRRPPPTPQPSLPVSVVVEAELHAAEVYHDAARHFLDVQLSTMDSLGDKTTQYLSVASLALPVTFALLRTATDPTNPLPNQAQGTLLAALVAYLLVLVFASLAGRISALEYRPNIATVKAHSETLSGVYLKQWVANEYEASITENRTVLERKSRWVGPRRSRSSSRASACHWRRSLPSYCDVTVRGGGNGFGVRTTMFEGPGGGSWLGFGLVVGGAGWGVVAGCDVMAIHLLLS